MDKKNRQLNANSRSHENDSSQNKKLRVGTGVVLTVLVLCIVVMTAKSLFSNNTDIPEGVYTGTINTDQTKPAATEANADAKTDNKKKTDSETEESKTESKADESSVVKTDETAYVTQYAYLREKPEQSGKEIVCMSPNIEVNVIEKLENGYWKVTFMNVDGQKTGYVWNEYLQDTPLNNQGQ